MAGVCFVCCDCGSFAVSDMIPLNGQLYAVRIRLVLPHFLGALCIEARSLECCLNSHEGRFSISFDAAAHVDVRTWLWIPSFGEGMIAEDLSELLSIWGKQRQHSLHAGVKMADAGQLHVSHAGRLQADVVSLLHASYLILICAMFMP
eukprot:scaffold154393_cov19-Tisochrysis_lutea.AAC.1